ncbi:MAG: hypothetical protein Q4A71_07165 [Actinomycetaceae bacterium]|nr:hypothetical protein [Actinomycetaceae bacterium]
MLGTTAAAGALIGISALAPFRVFVAVIALLVGAFATGWGGAVGAPSKSASSAVATMVGTWTFFIGLIYADFAVVPFVFAFAPITAFIAEFFRSRHTHVAVSIVTSAGGALVATIGAGWVTLDQVATWRTLASPMGWMLCFVPLVVFAKHRYLRALLGGAAGGVVAAATLWVAPKTVATIFAGVIPGSIGLPFFATTGGAVLFMVEGIIIDLLGNGRSGRAGATALGTIIPLLTVIPTYAMVRIAAM